MIFADTVRAPFVTIAEETPTSLRVRWEAINLPVQSWTLVLSRLRDEEGEDATILKAC